MTAARSRPDASPTGRVVVVHGLGDASLELVLRQSGLVPVYKAEGAVIWAPPLPVLQPAEPSEALLGPRKLLLSIAEVADRLSVGRSTVYELISHGDLEVVHVGRAARVPAASVEALVQTLRAG